MDKGIHSEQQQKSDKSILVKCNSRIQSVVIWGITVKIFQLYVFEKFLTASWKIMFKDRK